MDCDVKTVALIFLRFAVFSDAMYDASRDGGSRKEEHGE